MPELRQSSKAGGSFSLKSGSGWQNDAGRQPHFADGRFLPNADVAKGTAGKPLTS